MAVGNGRQDSDPDEREEQMAYEMLHFLKTVKKDFDILVALTSGQIPIMKTVANSPRRSGIRW